MTYFVRSAAGTDYRVGLWQDGQWFPGDLMDANLEHGLLNEPGSYVWGRSW